MTEPVNTTPSPEGHDAAMIAKVDANAAAALAAAGGTPANPVTPPEVPARPESVPEKFWDATKGTVNTEALLKSYTELEKAKAGSPTTPASAAAETPPASETPPADAAKAAVGEDAFAAFTAEFAEKGSLSDESYKALADKGLPKDLVDGYIQGQVALQSSVEAKAFALAGGNEQYATMTKWAATSLTASEIDAFDKAVLTGQDAQVSQAILGLKARYEASYGSSQNGMVNGAPSEYVKGYGSTAEMTSDMKDARYAKDPAYRAQVEARLAATTAF